MPVDIFGVNIWCYLDVNSLAIKFLPFETPKRSTSTMATSTLRDRAYFLSTRAFLYGEVGTCTIGNREASCRGYFARRA